MKITEQEETKINQSYRANGEIICEVCGKKYYDHPLYYPSGKISYDGYPFLNRICNGDLVKL